MANDLAPASGWPRLRSPSRLARPIRAIIPAVPATPSSAAAAAASRASPSGRPAGLGCAQRLDHRVEGVEQGLVADRGMPQPDDRLLGGLGRAAHLGHAGRGGGFRVEPARDRAERRRIERSDGAADAGHRRRRGPDQVRGRRVVRERRQPATDVPRADAHRHAVVAVAGGTVERPELIPRLVHRAGRGQDRGPEVAGHRLNRAACAGASRRPASSASSVVTVTDAPPISSDVMKLPTRLRLTWLPAASSARRAAR